MHASISFLNEWAEYLKCNVGAAIFQEQQAIEEGMILRNEMGHMVGCNLRRTNSLFLSKEAKAIGVREAIT